MTSRSHNAKRRIDEGPGLFDHLTLHAPRIPTGFSCGVSSKSEPATSLPKAPDAAPLGPKTPLNESVSLVQLRLSDICDPELSRRALTASSSLLVLPLGFSFPYHLKVLEPLAEVRRAAKVPPRIPGVGPEGVSYSHQNELRAHASLQLLAERLGPVALVDRILLQRAISYTEGPAATRHYLARMFRDSPSDRQRQLLPFVQRAFIPEGAGRLAGDLVRKDLAQLFASGTLWAPEHPKETAIRNMVEEGRVLKEGGRIVVIGADPQTLKYLRLRAQHWSRIQVDENPVLSAKKSERNEYQRRLASPVEDYEIHCLALEPKHLHALQKSGVSHIHADLLVVHSLPVNQLSRELSLPAPSELPTMSVRQVIQLAASERVRTIKSLVYNPLNLRAL